VPARKAAFPIVDISRAMFLVYPTCTTKPMGRMEGYDADLAVRVGVNHVPT